MSKWLSSSLSSGMAQTSSICSSSSKQSSSASALLISCSKSSMDLALSLITRTSLLYFFSNQEVAQLMLWILVEQFIDYWAFFFSQEGRMVLDWRCWKTFCSSCLSDCSCFLASFSSKLCSSRASLMETLSNSFPPAKPLTSIFISSSVLFRRELISSFPLALQSLRLNCTLSCFLSTPSRLFLASITCLLLFSISYFFSSICILMVLEPLSSSRQSAFSSISLMKVSLMLLMLLFLFTQND